MSLLYNESMVSCSEFMSFHRDERSKTRYQMIKIYKILCA